MKTATLTRFGSIPGKGTFGELTFGKMSLYTVEQVWADNQPFVSCVPAGTYTVEPHEGRGPWVLTSEPLAVTRWQEHGSKRYTCLFHAANRASELQGCIAPGMSLGLVGGEWAVGSSGAAIRRMMNYFGPSEPWELCIQWQNVVYNPLSED